MAEIRRNRFIPFLRVLLQSELQTASYRLWTQLIKSISYKNNHYAMYAAIHSMLKCVYLSEEQKQTKFRYLISTWILTGPHAPAKTIRGDFQGHLRSVEIIRWHNIPFLVKQNGKKIFIWNTKMLFDFLTSKMRYTTQNPCFLVWFGLVWFICLMAYQPCGFNIKTILVEGQ